MSILETIVNSTAAALIVRSDKDAVRALLKIIEDSGIELDSTDQAIVDACKAR